MEIAALRVEAVVSAVLSGHRSASEPAIGDCNLPEDIVNELMIAEPLRGDADEQAERDGATLMLFSCCRARGCAVSCGWGGKAPRYGGIFFAGAARVLTVLMSGGDSSA